jgi:hypothetical protein
MTEVSSIVSLDRDGAGRPTCLRAMTEGDTISDSVLSQNVNDAVTEVNNNSNDWNDAYQVVLDNSASWNAAVTGVVAYLDDVGDVNTETATADQTIVYDGAYWNNVDYALSTLSDTLISTPANKSALTYDAGKWVDTSLINFIKLDELDGVNVPSPNSNNVLAFDGANWINRPIATVVQNAQGTIQHSWLNGTGTNTHAQIDTQLTNLNTTATIVANNYVNWNTAYSHVSVTGNPHSTDLTDLEDVNIPSTPTDGYVLTWNNTGNYWEAQAPTGGGATDLDDLTDVVVVTPASNQFLVYDTTSWTNKQAQHTWLNGTGTNSHTQIDSHVLGVVNASSNWQAGYTFYTASADELASVYKTTLDGSVGWEAAYQHTQDLVSNPHMVTAEQVGNTVSQWNASALDGYKVSFVDTPPTFTGSQLIYNIEKGFWEANRQSFTLMAPNTGSNVTNTSSITLIGAQGITVSGSTNTLTFSISSNTISQWNASALRGSPLSATLVPTTNQALVYDGSVWTASSISTGGGGVTDHGALTGLADDDHPQYVLSATNNALSSLVNNHIASAVHWDIATLNSNYINASGDSANAAFFFQTLSATTVSATTYLNVRPNVSSVNSAATTSFTAGGDYDTYLINTTTTSVIAYLPEASSYTNKMITFSKVDDGGSYRSVTVSGAQLVTATNTVILYDPTESVTVISNGTNWYSLDYDRSYGVVFVCKNSTGATLTKGTPVRVSGATGANVLITPASAVNNAVPESPSGFLARVIGVVEHDIPNGEFGHVLTKGSLYKYNTNGFNEGDALYLAANGGLTNIKPTPPYEEIFIGIVTRKQAVNGSLLIDIQNPEHINSIVGFDLASSISERDVIAYDLTTSTFKNYNPSSFNVSSATSATLALSATSALNAQEAPNGFTVTGTLTATTASATTYLNLPSSIATWNASALQGSPLSATLAPTTNQGLIYNGSVWTASTLPAVITDHGTLTGLADDDHPQYVLSSTNNALSSLVNNHIASASVHFVMSSIDHTLIQNIGTNSHADIDNHISDQNNPHIVTAEQVGNTTAQWNASSLFGYEVKNSNPNNEDILQWSNSTLLWAPTPISNTTAKWNASAIAGSPLSATLGPTTGQSLVYNGTVWTASTVVATGGGGGGIADASSLRGSPLSATLVPTAGQALMYNGSVWTASAALFAYTYGSGAPTGGSDGDIYLQTDVEALQVATVSATTYLNLPSSVITWTNATSATNAFSSTYALSATSALNAQQAPNGFTVTGTLSSTNLLTTSGDVSAVRLTDYSERKSAPTISSSSLTLDLNAAQVFTVSLNSNISTLTISNTESRANSVQGFTLILTADGTARTITWPGSVKWPSGTGPTLTSTNAKVDILSFVSPDNGTTWYGFIGGQNY